MNTLILSGSQSLRVREYHLEVYDTQTRSEVKRFYMREVPFDSVIVTALGGFLTFEAISFLATHNVPILFLNPAGRLESVILHGEHSFKSENRIAQYQAYLNADLRARITGEILKVKAQSQFSLVRELSRTYGFDFKEEDLMQSDERKQSAAYFGYLTQVFNRLYKDAEYRGRRAESNMMNMNASHPVNSLLNFGYSVLEGKVRTILWEFGLDSALGFNHEHHRGKDSLAFDLIEPFRADVDCAVIRLLESKPRITRKDFEITNAYVSRLKPDTIKRLLSFVDLNDERIRERVRWLMKTIGARENQGSSMNKSTLWFQEQSARKRRSRRIYRKSLEELVLSR